jgi:hypothetical protein
VTSPLAAEQPHPAPALTHAHQKSLMLTRPAAVPTPGGGNRSQGFTCRRTYRPSRTMAATIWTWRSAAVFENSFS